MQNMCKKLNKHMGNIITVISNKKKIGTIVYKTDAVSEQTLQLVAISQESGYDNSQEYANILTSDILTSEKTPLNISSVDTIIVELSTPDNVFFLSKCYIIEIRGQLAHKNKDLLILVQLMQYTAALGQNFFQISILLMHNFEIYEW